LKFSFDKPHKEGKKCLLYELHDGGKTCFQGDLLLYILISLMKLIINSIVDSVKVVSCHLVNDYIICKVWRVRYKKGNKEYSMFVSEIRG